MDLSNLKVDVGHIMTKQQFEAHMKAKREDPKNAIINQGSPMVLDPRKKLQNTLRSKQAARSKKVSTNTKDVETATHTIDGDMVRVSQG